MRKEAKNQNEERMAMRSQGGRFQRTVNLLSLGLTVVLCPHNLSIMDTVFPK